MTTIVSGVRGLRGLNLSVWAWVTALVLMTGPATAAPGKLDGFLSLKWGDSEASATAAMNQQFRFYSKRDGYRTFSGTFAGYPGSWVHVYAKRDQVYGVRVVLGTPSGRDPFALHKEVAGNLQQKYGAHTNATFVRGDRSKGDYDDLAPAANRTAAKIAAYDSLVRTGDGCYGTNWYFEDGNAVTLRLQRFDKDGPPMVSIDYWSVKTQQAIDASDSPGL